MQQDNTEKTLANTGEMAPDSRESPDPFQLVGDHDAPTADQAGLARDATAEHRPDQASSDQNHEFSIVKLRTAADEFNTVFTVALHELENTRRQLADRTAKIDELNVAIRESGAALQAQAESYHRQQEIHSAETDRLNGRISELEEQHAATLQQIETQHGELEVRAREATELGSQIEELTRALDTQWKSFRQQQEDHAGETAALNQRIRELDEQRDTALQQIEVQREELETRTREVTELGNRVEELNSTLDTQSESLHQQQEDHAGETTALNQRIRELDEQRNTALQQIEAQREELEARTREVTELGSKVEVLTGSLNSQSESNRHLEEAHARVINEHNLKVTDLADALQQTQARCQELEEHAGKIEKLNNTLHEASLAEAELYRRKLEASTREKAELSGKVEQLNSALRETGEHQAQNPADIQTIESLQEKIGKLGTALQQSEARCGELEATLRHAGDSPAAGVADNQTIENLQHRVEELGLKLDQAEAQRDEVEAGTGKVTELASRVEELSGALETAEQALRLVDEHATDPVIYIRGGAYIYANHSYRNITNAPAGEASQIPCLQKFIAQDQLDRFMQLLAGDAAARGNTDPARFKLNLPEGNAAAAVLQIMRVPFAGESCTRLAIRLERQQTCPAVIQGEPEQQDLLTGLCNRQYFIRILQDQVREGPHGDSQQAVLYVLLDNFMKIRGDIGILNSESVLQDIGELLKSCFAESDVIARFGEYVFTILHRSNNTEDFATKAEQVRELVESHIVEVGERTVVTTASIGISILNDHTQDVNDLLTRADLACEVARTSGGNQVHIHSTIIDAQADHDNEQNWDRMIRKTLEEERFYIVHQPIISLSDEPGSRYEVLLRILDEGGNVILPGQFFSIAEQIGLAAVIDRIVIENVFRTATGDSNSEIMLFIKLSGSSVADADLAVWILQKLGEYRLAGERIVFEIPEQLVARDLKNAAMLTKALHAMHCKVAIEHYTGITRPQHLQHVHADFLKIDGNLVASLEDDRENRSKIAAIVDLAKQYRMETIAERVEDAANLALLWDLGVKYALGNFIQEPCRNMDYDFYGEIVTEGVPDGSAACRTND